MGCAAFLAGNRIDPFTVGSTTNKWVEFGSFETSLSTRVGILILATPR